METSDILIDLELGYWESKLKGLKSGRKIRRKIGSYLPGARSLCTKSELLLATKLTYRELATRRYLGL